MSMTTTLGQKKRDKRELPLEPEFTRSLGLPTQEAPYSVPPPPLEMAERKAKPAKLGDGKCSRGEGWGSGSLFQTSDRESEQKARGRKMWDLERDTEAEEEAVLSHSQHTFIECLLCARK